MLTECLWVFGHNLNFFLDFFRYPVLIFRPTLHDPSLPGWNFNPSSWNRFQISSNRYLGKLDLIPARWDSFPPGILLNLFFFFFFFVNFPSCWTTVSFRSGGMKQVQGNGLTQQSEFRQSKRMIPPCRD